MFVKRQGINHRKLTAYLAAFVIMNQVRSQTMGNITHDNSDEKRNDLLYIYLHLINHILPVTFTHPVCLNHCFARIVLDWTFSDCWYNHLHKNGPAYLQLSDAQLQATIVRMNAWLQDRQLLVQDNEASLRYRKKPGNR